jgi:histidine triad (HIT) family protein
MSTLFSKIIRREIPAYIVAEEEAQIAFLDINPLARGHVLVVPKKEVDYYFDLPDNEFIDLNLFAKRVANALEKTIPCQRIGLAVVGLEIPHVHVHLIPLNTMEDIDFNKPKLQLTDEEMKEIAYSVRKTYKALY